MRSGAGDVRKSAVAAALTLVATVAACGSRAKAPSTEPLAPVAKVGSRCPDLGKADDLAAFDFAKEYALSPAAAEKLKAAALAAMEVGILAEKLDAELGLACAQIAADLGDRGDYRGGNEACAGAVKTIREARARLGPKSQVHLVSRAPICASDATLMTKCASICDSSVAAQKVKAECQARTGRCDGNCEGLCEPRSPMKCDGNCSGTCDGPIHGACGGRCKGTCDGKKENGPCTGVCVGTCERGAMNGECKGKCLGACKLAKAGVCPGNCVGGCSVELAEEKCAGEFKAPEVSTDCRARCELEVINNTECSLPKVGYVVIGTKDRETAEAIKTAVDKAFPSLIKVLSEVGEKGPKRVLNAQAIIEAARSGFKEMALSGGKPSASAAEAQLAKCFEAPFKKAEADARTIKEGLDQATAVREEATK